MQMELFLTTTERWWVRVQFQEEQIQFQQGELRISSKRLRWRSTSLKVKKEAAWDTEEVNLLTKVAISIIWKDRMKLALMVTWNHFMITPQQLVTLVLTCKWTRRCTLSTKSWKWETLLLRSSLHILMDSHPPLLKDLPWLIIIISIAKLPKRETPLIWLTELTPRRMTSLRYILRRFLK